MIKKSAFTLIELLVVVAIVGILAAVGIPSYNGYMEEAKKSNAVSNLQSIFLLEQDVYSDNRSYLDDSVDPMKTFVQKIDNSDEYFAYSITTSDDDQSFTATATYEEDNNKKINIDENQTITYEGY